MITTAAIADLTPWPASHKQSRFLCQIRDSGRQCKPPLSNRQQKLRGRKPSRKEVPINLHHEKVETLADQVGIIYNPPSRGLLTQPLPQCVTGPKKEGDYSHVHSSDSCHALPSICARFWPVCGNLIAHPSLSVEVKEASMSAVFTSHDKRPRDLALTAIEEALGSIGGVGQEILQFE